MQLMGYCVGRMSEVNALKVLAINGLDEKLLEFARSEGIEVVTNSTEVTEEVFDKILWFPSHGLLTPIADWFQEVSCETLVIAADGARNVGLIRFSFNAKRIVLLSFFSLDASFSIPSEKILEGAEVIRECVSRSEYWNATERVLDNIGTIDTERIILDNHDLLFVYRNGWSEQINHVISQLTDYILKFGEVRRVIVRGPRGDSVNSEPEEYLLARWIQENIDESISVTEWSHLVTDQEKKEDFAHNPELLINSNKFGRPGFIFPFEGTLGILLNVNEAYTKVETISVDDIGHKVDMDRPDQIAIVEQSNWVKQHSKPSREIELAVRRETYLKLENDNNLQHLRLLAIRYFPLRGKIRARVRYFAQRLFLGRT